MFNSSMSEEDFFKWLKSKGIGEKDCKTLSGNDNNFICAVAMRVLIIAICIH